VRAAILRNYGEPPHPGEFEDPEPGGGEAIVDVLAAGLNPVDLSIASGSFYGGSPPLPSVVGREGVGRGADGKLAYFDGPVAPFGSFAERALVAEQSMIPIDAELDPALAVCFGIAGLAAWLALEWRAELHEGETVLVLGASGVVGQIAVQAAKLMGAGRVVAAARSADGLERARQYGADATVQIGAVDDLAEAIREAAAGELHVIVDPLWGEPAAAAIEAASRGARLVQLGQSAGRTSTIASPPIRGRLLAILGHTNFLAPPDVKRAAYTRMVEHAAAGRLAVEVERIALADVADAWSRQASSPRQKLVIVP
jgi:NADPH2:quinone reductase